MIDFPRPKIGVARRCPLWPETVAAAKESLAERPAPRREANEGLVFFKKYGLLWRRQAGVNRPVSTGQDGIHTLGTAVLANPWIGQLVWDHLP
jgi:hypothetical protein